MGGLFSCCDDCFGGKGNGNSSGAGNAGSGGRDSYHTISGRVQPQPLQPDPEEKRRQLAEAAEKRRSEQEHRGVKNVDSIRRQQQRSEEMEKREQELTKKGIDGPVMRWQMS